MEVNCIIKMDRLLNEESTAADPEDSLKVRGSDPERTDKKHQDKQPLKLPKKHLYDNSQGNKQHKETAESLNEKIHMSASPRGFREQGNWNIYC